MLYLCNFGKNPLLAQVYCADKIMYRLNPHLHIKGLFSPRADGIYIIDELSGASVALVSFVSGWFKVLPSNMTEVLTTGTFNHNSPLVGRGT